MKIMLQNEFEERIGREVTEREYAKANAMYMAAGSIDKDTFCREWIRIGSSPLLEGLYVSYCDIAKHNEHLLRLLYKK